MRRFAGVALAAVALLVSACGGGDELKATSASLGRDSNGEAIDIDEVTAAPDGRLWVEVNAGIVPVDPDERKLAGRPREIPGNPLVYDLSAGEEGVWAAAANDDHSISLIPIDPKSGVIGKPARTGLDAEFLDAGDGFEVAVGAGRVWAAREGSGDLVLLDPATGKQEELGADNVEDIAAGGGYGWVANESPPDDPLANEGSLERVDPKTGDVELTELDVEPTAIAYGAGSVWVHLGDEVKRFDDQGQEQATIDLEDDVEDFDGGVGDIAVAGDTVWVTGFGDKRVVAIDAKENKVKKVVKTPTDEPRDLAATGDSAWIALNDEAPLRVGPG